MDSSQLPKRTRHRALSVTVATEDQQEAMTTSLDHLQNDLNYISSNWPNALTESTNPLELALSLLDSSPTGMNNRLPEFYKLQKKISYDLQSTVNEHYQEFNSNVASYGTVVNFITDAQENILKVRSSLNEASRKITVKKGPLNDLNEESQKYTDMLKTLWAIEALLVSPEKVETFIRNENYREAQRELVNTYLIANSHSLWKLPSLKPVKEQLLFQEHSLFNSIVEDIHNLVYSKTSFKFANSSLMKDISTPKNGFTGVENYLNNIVNTDFVSKANNINIELKEFINELDNLDRDNLKKLDKLKGRSEYEKVFTLLSITNDMNKLPQASNIFIDRAKSEIHMVLVNTTESVRSKHPSLLRLADDMSKQGDFGISLENMLSIILRTMFWENFLKLLVVMQGHYLIYKIIGILQKRSNVQNTYKLQDIWKAMVGEVSEFLTKYLRDPKIFVEDTKVQDIEGKDTDETNITETIYTLQDNIEDSGEIKQYSDNLKDLLKDIFPGFTVSTNLDITSIYIKEDVLEQDNSLIPPSIFNMRLILEPLLLFTKAVEQVLPEDTIAKDKSSKVFFINYLNSEIYPDFQKTLTFLFNSKIRSTNPYKIHHMSNNKKIFSAAYDFRMFFSSLIFITRTSHSYKKLIANALISTLESFFKYYENIFDHLFGTKTKNNLARQIITVWLLDEEILKTEEEIISDKKFIGEEYDLLMNYCSNFFEEGKGLSPGDLFNNVTLDAIVYFYSTVSWILEWLPFMKKVINQDSERDLYDITQLRNDWSLFESPTTVREDSMKTLKICMTQKMGNKFDQIVESFRHLKMKLMEVLRFDVHARSIYYIGRMFQENKDWYLATDSFELDYQISSLRSDLIRHENKMENHLSSEDKDTVFLGLDKFCSIMFVKGSVSMQTLNENGIKKIIKNINALQSTCRNLFSDSSDVDMNYSIAFYSLCNEEESSFFKELEENELFKYYSQTDLEVALRLLYSVEIYEYIKRNKSVSNKSGELTGPQKRYQNALQKLSNALTERDTSNPNRQLKRLATSDMLASQISTSKSRQPLKTAPQNSIPSPQIKNTLPQNDVKSQPVSQNLGQPQPQTTKSNTTSPQISSQLPTQTTNINHTQSQNSNIPLHQPRETGIPTTKLTQVSSPSVGTPKPISHQPQVRQPVSQTPQTHHTISQSPQLHTPISQTPQVHSPISQIPQVQKTSIQTQQPQKQTLQSPQIQKPISQVPQLQSKTIEQPSVFKAQSQHSPAQQSPSHNPILQQSNIQPPLQLPSIAQTTRQLDINQTPKVQTTQPTRLPQLSTDHSFNSLKNSTLETPLSQVMQDPFATDEEEEIKPLNIRKPKAPPSSNIPQVPISSQSISRVNNLQSPREQDITLSKMSLAQQHKVQLPQPTSSQSKAPTTPQPKLPPPKPSPVSPNQPSIPQHRPSRGKEL